MFSTTTVILKNKPKKNHTHQYPFQEETLLKPLQQKCYVLRKTLLEVENLLKSQNNSVPKKLFLNNIQKFCNLEVIYTWDFFEKCRDKRWDGLQITLYNSYRF